ncbi:MAG TPA: glycosyltransferase [Candidatus Didemnitutus sp.]|nr:glycosyltransferase [Candidatus Didemnitutus sp.]
MPKVSVAMLAYNHEKYVAQAIESVLAQQTDFAIELVIGEDESVDGTAAICRDYAARYPEIIRLFLRKRDDPGRKNYPHPAFFNVGETLKACRADFIAYLDGDDYWTDPRKLQIQVDFLERNPGATFCSHRYKRLFQEKNELLNDRFDAEFEGHEQRTVTFDNFLDPPFLLSSFMVLRRSAMDGYFEKQCGWDTCLWAHLLSRGGHAIVLNRFMGVYRKHAGGVWSSLAERMMHKQSHAQHCMLVANEGFRSACIREAYLASAAACSNDLATEAIETVRAWERHTNKTRDTLQLLSARRPSRVGNLFLDLAVSAQVRLLQIHAKNFRLSPQPPERLDRRLLRLTQLAINLTAAAPFLLLTALSRAMRHSPDGNAPEASTR